MYAFVHNNPLHYFDRFGLNSENRHSQGFEQYFYDEYETHCFCERHRKCKRGGDLDKFSFYDPSVFCDPNLEPFEIFFDYFKELFKVKSRIYNLSDEKKFQTLSNGMIGFVNGINTSLDGAKSHARYLGNLAGDYNIHGVYNASNGFGIDGLEYYLSRDYGFITPPVRLLQKQWDDFFANAGFGGIILQNCHSYGAVIVRNALDSYPTELRNRIIVIAIAPGVYIDRDLCKEIRHYVSDDIVRYLDPEGYVRNMDNIIVLKRHRNAPKLDHDFQSPTYESVLFDEIDKYINQYGK